MNLKAFDKGPDAGKSSVKYKDNPHWWTSTGFCWGSSVVIPLQVTYDCSRRRPDFRCFIEVTMTVVKYVSDWLRDYESETQLNLDRPLRISSGPRHLSRPPIPATITGLPPPHYPSTFCFE